MRHASIIIFALIGLVSCHMVRYVPVETVKVETEYKDRLIRDSSYVIDSVIIHERGDTVYRDRWRTEYRDRWRRDTIAFNHTDSVKVPYPVEKKLGVWEQTKVSYGGYALLLVFITILVVFGRIVYKLRK